MSPVYDRRFVGAFLSELQKRNNPSYPALEWWRALRAADLQAANLPPRDFRAELSSIQANARHERKPSGDKYLMVSVDLACRRWWRKHGITVK